MDQRHAHIICACGQVFQVLKNLEVEPQRFTVEWDEVETHQALQNHLKICTGRR